MCRTCVLALLVMDNAKEAVGMGLEVSALIDCFNIFYDSQISPRSISVSRVSFMVSR